MDPMETVDCGEQQHANTHGPTIDGAVHLTTILPLLALVWLSSDDFSKSHTVQANQDKEDIKLYKMCH